MITTFVLTNVRLYRDGLAASLANREGVRVLGCGGFNTESFDLLGSLGPDIVITGYPGPGCESAMEKLVASLPKSRFVVIGSGDSEPEILAYAALGVSGIVPLDASLDDLILTLKCAARGEFCCSPKATAALARRIARDAGRSHGMRSSSITLTRREHEIAGLIERGYSNKQIARALDIQLPTVKNHVHKILDKLEVSSRGQAAARLRRDVDTVASATRASAAF